MSVNNALVTMMVVVAVVLPVSQSTSILNKAMDCASGFPVNLSGVECWGLEQATKTPMGAPIKTADDCAATCCAMSTSNCDTFNFCSGPTSQCSGKTSGGCWLGAIGQSATCRKTTGWVGGRRGVAPSPPPPAPGTPNLLSLVEPDVPTPIPFTLGPNVDPEGNNISVDSTSLFYNQKRWYPVNGEIHLARVPASQWKEQLLRMKAGGLDGVAVYVFWIHHEEVEGQFDFSGRRNISQFFSLVKQVGLKALLRAGPWDHGECRNGGHPDWILEKSKTEGFPLRSNNTGYLNYVQKWYMQLAAQTKGMYFKDGGPIWAVQVDNETPDWHYLLALKKIGESVGMNPVSYTKTGWPAPGPGYPSNYPMLPYFGGYADLFWSNTMAPGTSPSQYKFNHGPSTKYTNLKWTVPQGYPWLDVEIGGGMAAAYNHRVHMDSPDMPAMHLVDVANGVNGLGYYMYHGGNNPRSVAGEPNPDDPRNTLQESSFQPSGAANPMPSYSYDFYAPLGEMGQPRKHFHQMRRLHLMVSSFEMASLKSAFPAQSPGDSDLRYAARSDGTSGFLFVNNYQRLTSMPSHSEVKFNISLVDNSTIMIPSGASNGFDVLPGTWFAWPINQVLPLNDECGSLTLSFGMAQLVTTIKLGSNHCMLVAAANTGIVPELGFVSDEVRISGITGGASIAIDGKYSVVKNIAPSVQANFDVNTKQGKYTIVVLPPSLHDRVWKYSIAGQDRVFIGNENTSLVLAETSTLHLRGNTSEMSFLAAPPFSQTTKSPTTPYGSIESVEAAGAFTKYTVNVGETQVPKAEWTLTASASPARDIPIAPTKKAEEPTANDWLQGANYTISLSPAIDGPSSNVEFRVAVNYLADAARVFSEDLCLTDNWYSGYSEDGRLEIGLNYLYGENPNIFKSNLTMVILPLKKSSLETNVFLQQKLWPDFGSADTILKIQSIDVIPTFKISLDVK